MLASSLAEIVSILLGVLVIRFLIVAAGVVIAASTAASADSGRQALVLRTYQPVRIAVPDFVAGSLSEAEAAYAISRIVASDLAQGSVFAPIDPALFVEKNAGIADLPEFADWRAIRAQELVVGRVTRQADARIKIEFRLWDTSSGTQLMGLQYTVNPDDVNRVGHVIASDIHERITGTKLTID